MYLEQKLFCVHNASVFGVGLDINGLILNAPHIFLSLPCACSLHGKHPRLCYFNSLKWGIETDYF